MKKLSFLFVLVALAASCKNEPKTGALTQEALHSGNNIEQAGAILDAAKTTLAEMQSMRKQIDDLPDAVKNANPTDIENLRGTLEGMEEKETMFIKQLEGALSLTAPPVPKTGTTEQTGDEVAGNSAVVKECMESLTLLAEEMKVMKEQFNALLKKQ